MEIPKKILKFKVNGKLFGIDGEIVDKILEVPPITPIPLSDKRVLGVCVLFGKIVNVLDAGLLLGLEGVNLKSKESRIITLNLRDNIDAICVDEVVVISDVEEDKYEQNKDDGAIVGFLKDDDGLVQIIDPFKLFEGIGVLEFTPIGISTIGLEEGNEKSEGVLDETKKYLLFRISDEEFGVDIDIIKEIVFLPDDVIPIAGSDAMGMMKLRDRVLSLVDLREKLGFDAIGFTPKTRCLIAEDRNREVGLVVDEVMEVKDIPISLIEKVTEEFQSDFVEGIFKEDDKVISILSSSFVSSLVKEYYIQEEKETSNNTQIRDEDMSEVVVFSINGEEYAFDVDDVQEIIKYAQLTPIPDAPEFLEGILNLRGAVIPIVSLPKRLGFEQKITEKSKIIVCNIKNEKLGFIVDEVNEVLFVDNKYISNAKSEDAVFNQVITLDGNKRVILKLKPQQLFDDEFFESIATIKE